MFQPQHQSDVTDVLIRNHLGGEKKLQLVHGDPLFQRSRPQLLKGQVLTRLVQDIKLVTNMISEMTMQKIEKYHDRARGHSLVLHGGPFDDLETVRAACQVVTGRLQGHEIYFDEVLYLYYPFSKITEGELVKIA